jgi:dimethylglycine dehydrogenase
MRMEMGFVHWKADLITEFDPFETGLARFVKMEKGDFIGKAALLERQARGPIRKLVTLTIDATHAPARPGASLMRGAKVVGTITSADYGHRVGMNLAYAFVDADLARTGSALVLDLLGDCVDARVIDQAPYDPDFERMRR